MIKEEDDQIVDNDNEKQEAEEEGERKALCICVSLPFSFFPYLTLWSHLINDLHFVLSFLRTESFLLFSKMDIFSCNEERQYYDTQNIIIIRCPPHCFPSCQTFDTRSDLHPRSIVSTCAYVYMTKFLQYTRKIYEKNYLSFEWLVTYFFFFDNLTDYIRSVVLILLCHGLRFVLALLSTWSIIWFFSKWVLIRENNLPRQSKELYRDGEKRLIMLDWRLPTICSMTITQGNQSTIYGKFLLITFFVSICHSMRICLSENEGNTFPCQITL